MANKRITELTDIGTPNPLDVLEIVDVSDTTDSPEGTSKKVKVSELGGGSQDLQGVRDINPNVIVTNGGEIGAWNSLQYSEDSLRIEDNFTIYQTAGDIRHSISRIAIATDNLLYSTRTDTLEDTQKIGTVGTLQGKAMFFENTFDGATSEVGSHKIELDPVLGEEVVFKTPSGKTTGTYTLATTEDIGGSEWIVISANKTAVNDEQYSNVANATYTDPSPVEGKGYNVKVVNGTATIGGVGYAEGRIITRTYHSGSWRSKVYVDESIVGSATVTALNGKQNKEDFVKIASAHSLTNTTALQSITNVAHNVEVGTYRFYCRFSLSGLAGGTISFGSLGTATISIGNWISNANKQNAFPNTNIIAYGSLPSVVQIIGASAGTNGVVTIEGDVTFSSSGTFIPSIALSSAPSSGQTDAGAYTSLIKLS